MIDVKNYKEIRSKTIWITRAGESKPIKRMENSHIQNTIILLNKKVISCKELGLGSFDIYGKSGEEWIELLSLELKYRQDPKSILPKKEEEILVAPLKYTLVEEEML